MKQSSGHYKKYYDGTLELFSNVPNATSFHEPTLNFEIPFTIVQGAVCSLANGDTSGIYSGDRRIISLTKDSIQLDRAHPMASIMFIHVWGRWK